MPQSLRIVLVTVPLEETRLNLADFLPWIQAEFTNDPGCRRCSVWQRTDRKAELAIILEFKDSGAASQIEDRLAQSPFYAEVISLNPTAPDIKPAQVLHRHGQPEDVGPHGYLSLSMRLADPGLGADLVAEVVDIFESLEVIEGCRAWIVARHEQLPEEVFGLVFWDTSEEFRQSLPSKTLYEVRLYRRLI